MRLDLVTTGSYYYFLFVWKLAMSKQITESERLIVLFGSVFYPMDAGEPELHEFGHETEYVLRPKQRPVSRITSPVAMAKKLVTTRKFFDGIRRKPVGRQTALQDYEQARKQTHACLRFGPCELPTR